MAGRDSGAASANVTRPQWRDVGAKVMLGAKVLEQAAEMLQDVEHYPIWAIGLGVGRRCVVARGLGGRSLAGARVRAGPHMIVIADERTDVANPKERGGSFRARPSRRLLSQRSEAQHS